MFDGTHTVFGVRTGACRIDGIHLPEGWDYMPGIDCVIYFPSEKVCAPIMLHGILARKL